MEMPYEWEHDIDNNTTGANIHAVGECKSRIYLCLRRINLEKERGNKEKYDHYVRRMNKILLDGYEKGFMSYKYTYKGELR